MLRSSHRAACGIQQHGGAPAGLDHAEQARTLACQAGFRLLEGRAHGALAAIRLDLHDHGEATKHARRALAIHRETGHRPGQAHALATLAHARRQAGDLGAARSCWQEAQGLLADMSVPDADQVHALLDTLPAPPDPC